MNSQESSETKPEFTRRSETESICMFCSQLIRTDRWTPLDVAESIHSEVCLQRVDSAVRYALLW
jgi:hypothetical protein